MRKPEESLDDFNVKAVVEKAAEPPAVVSLRSRGGFKVLKPLARREVLLNPARAAGNTVLRHNTYRLSWFQSALASAGALGVMALVLGSAVLIGVYDPPPGPEVSIVEEASDDTSNAPIVSQLEDGSIQTEEPINAEVHNAQSTPHADEVVHPVRKAAKPVPARHVQIAAHKPRTRSRRPQPATTKFVPTTLVISAENGEVKTRIEPWIAAVYKGF